MAAGFIKKEKDAAVQKKRALQDKGAEEGQKAEAQSPSVVSTSGNRVWRRLMDSRDSRKKQDAVRCTLKNPYRNRKDINKQTVIKTSGYCRNIISDCIGRYRAWETMQLSEQRYATDRRGQAEKSTGRMPWH